MKMANLALRFLLELAALAALGYWGFRTGSTPLLKGLLGLAAPLLMALVWGTWIAPAARRRLHDPPRLLLELGVWAAATVALIAAARPTWALGFALLVVINLGLMALWGQRGAA
jgi:hypothetical protein